LKKTKSNTVAIITGITCIILATALIGTIVNANGSQNTSMQDTIDNLNQQITDKETQLQQANQTIASLNQQIQELSQTPTPTPTPQPAHPTPTPQNNNAQITSLQNQIANQQTTINNLNNEIANLNATINNQKTQQPTLVFHVCEKGEGYDWGHLPNATDTYNQILAQDNNTHNIQLLPEYKGHENWTEELAWIADNFGGKSGIPLMLDVFGGGSNATPTPMLTPEQITDAMAVANIQSLRIAEVVSWHMENNQTFPTNYLTSLFDFAKTNNLTVVWTEWKAESFPIIKNKTKGYENLVTVSFSTNSQALQPTHGFLYLKENFQQWGASIQAWYWTTYQNQTLMDMPASLMLEHTLSAEGLGAKIIQFEPYWYLFDNGTANQNLKLLFNA
jgi:uncharacterized coiled-coil protein SlyX